MKRFFLRILFFVMALAVFSCDADLPQQPPKEREAAHGKSSEAGVQHPYRRSITAAKISLPDKNPVEHALQLLNLSRGDLVRPLAYEEGYQIIGRIPLIDQVSRSPFYLHQWADETSLLLNQNGEKGIHRALSFIIEVLNGGVAYRPQKPVIAGEITLQKAYIYLCQSNRVQPDKSGLERIVAAGFSNEFNQRLGSLVAALADATLLVKAAYAALSPGEMSYLSDRPERFFFPYDRQFNFLTAATPTQAKIVSTTRKIDFMKLFTAAATVTAALQEFTTYIQSLEDTADPARFFEDGARRDGIVLDIPSPVGRIVILGQDENVYDGNGLLVVDLGGNDFYTGGIAAGHLNPGRVAAAVDISGNDIYDARRQPLTQGAGVLGLGLLLDLAGNDQYRGGDMAQGAGIYGVGLLADFKGNDEYRMGQMGQGFGVFGAGLLLDKEGHDRYIINSLGQGAASTMGIGVLCDLHGRDKYFADIEQAYGKLGFDKWRHAQGAGLSIRSPNWANHFSLYGGIGFLSDGDGDDFYFCSGGNCMGSSYFMSIGALVDHKGDDKYIPQNGYGLGFAVHLSNAVFIDRQGNDYYFAKTHSGGVASDRSVAVMADYAGNDIYGPSEALVKQQISKQRGGHEKELTAVEWNQRIQEKLADVSYGSVMKPKALGLLIDYAGDDQYFARQNGRGESLGGVMPPTAPNNWSHALLLDLSGNDRYLGPSRKNNHYALYFQHGLCYDTEYEISAESTPGKERLPVYRGKGVMEALQQSRDIEDIRNLADPDLFVRYASIGRLNRMRPAVMDELIRLLLVSTEEDLNRDLIEAINTAVFGKMIQREQISRFESLLKAKDVFVRTYAARTLGWYQLKDALPALVSALNEENEAVRASIIWALGQMGSITVVDSLINTLQTDISMICRQNAMFALDALLEAVNPQDFAQNEKLKKSLLNALAESDEIIRTFAVKPLLFFTEKSDVVAALKGRLQDSSVYVRRQAARALILSGYREGIPVLIETLRYPSIDTFEHYDHELAKDLAYYTGVDFSEDQRYAYETWKNWWQANGSGFNLKQNLAIMKDIQKAFGASNEEEGIMIFERLMDQYPANVVVQRRYRRFCFEWITFRLLTRDQITRDILQRCLRLQEIKAKLEPENPQTLASLAYFYARLNKFDDAVSTLKKALRLDADNQDYHRTLELYEGMKQRRENRKDLGLLQHGSDAEDRKVEKRS